MHRSLSVLPMLCLAAGCGASDEARPAAAFTPPAAEWRMLATNEDRARLRGWRDSFVAALTRVRAGGGNAKLLSEGALLRPDAGLPDPAPPIGSYRCRIIKLGARTTGLSDYTAYPMFRCRIADAGGGRLSFAKLDGSQRPMGLLYPHDGERMVFLGTVMLGDERRPIDYGRDPERDMAGAVERIGPRRWRLLLPAPRWESLFDVMELVPG
jgi:hypothetical protein